MIHRILKNEKHAGDLLQKKYITSDYLTHRKVRNNGQEEQIYLRGHHEPIVDRATWDAVQRELARRSAQRGAKNEIFQPLLVFRQNTVRQLRQLLHPAHDYAAKWGSLSGLGLPRPCAVWEFGSRDSRTAVPAAICG